MLLREARPGEVSVLCVTSARNPDSTHDVSIKLAASMARLGTRTLLVDSDMRRPSLASRMISIRSWSPRSSSTFKAPG